MRLGEDESRTRRSYLDNIARRPGTEVRGGDDLLLRPGKELATVCGDDDCEARSEMVVVCDSEM